MREEYREVEVEVSIREVCELRSVCREGSLFQLRAALLTLGWGCLADAPGGGSSN